MHPKLPIFVSLTLALVAAGCGQAHDATVTGVVRQGGELLTTGTVTFHPVKEGPLATGDIQGDGSYTLKTGDQNGLDSGSYKATVVATGPMPEPTAQESEPLPKLLTAAQYGDPQTSRLQFDVKPGPNSIEIDLEKP
jgi:hypothetical protein